MRLSQILFAVSILLVASCTKVIHVNLNSSNPQYVVEGEVTNAPGPYQIHITRSVDFSQDNNFPAVTNALVVLTDHVSKADTLTQDSPGYYNTHTLQGIPGHTYQLIILVDGNILQSSSQMPQPVPFDSLFVVNEANIGKPKPRPHALFRDPVGTGNYYNFVLYKNHIRQKGLVFASDAINDGLQVDETLRGYDSLSSGDLISVDMQSINQPIYDYYYSLRQTIEQNSATPANPITNIQGSNVLGYFSANCSQVRSLTIP